MNTDKFYLQWYRSSKKLNIDTWMLAGLITSFFYCLPLGRYNVGFILTDFRVFDFVILIFMLVSGINLLLKANPLWKGGSFFTRPLRIFFYLIVIGLLVTAIYNFNRVLPASIRTFRFVSYLYAGLFTMLVVNTHQKFKFIAWVIILNIALQATIGFLQGVGILPNFWPEYWQLMYAESDAPVATLSPHHKHMGVVMLIGLGLFISIYKAERNWIVKLIFLIFILFTIMVPLFSGTRTFLLGLSFFGIAYFYKSSMDMFFFTIIISVFMVIFFSLFNLEGFVKQRLEEKYEQRIQSRIDKFGYEGLYRDRLFIYQKVPDVLLDNPHIILTGTGYQNVISFIGANGAHNNYLQVFLELGLFGLIVFLWMLRQILRNLRDAARVVQTRFEKNFINSTWIIFIGIMGTMFVGETLWGQPAMFTLTGQIMVLIGLCVSPYYWFILIRKENADQTAYAASKMSAEHN